MPKNRTQRIVFGIIMSYAMAYGMEVYNVAIREGVNLTPGGAAFAAKHCDPEKDNPYICRLLRQAGTIAVMCPAMSLVASILYNIIMDGMPVTKLPAVWIGTLIKNFPIAFFWNMFAAAPFSHWLFGKIFPDRG